MSNTGLKSGVKFGEKHSYNDFKLILASKDIGMPEPRTNYVEVPGRNGSLDLSEALTGEVSYNDREIMLSFIAMEAMTNKTWPKLLTEISNYLHGKKLKIVFDEDTDYYFLGRCAVTDFSAPKGAENLTITCTCDPFKYKKDKTVVTKTLTNTDQEIKLTNEFRPVIPEVNVTANTTLTINSSTVAITTGKHYLTQLRLTAGEKTIKAKLTPNAVENKEAADTAKTITITYQEGSL